MTTQRYSHTGNAADTTLQNAMTDTDLTFTVVPGGGTNYPVGTEGPGKFWIVIDPDQAGAEKLLCESRSGDTFTIAALTDRGLEGTAKVAHSAGAVVRHFFSETEADDASAHINASAGVHGITGSVVGTSDTQTLTGKTIDGGTNTLQNIPQSAVTGLTTALSAAAQTGHANTWTGKQTFHTSSGSSAEFKDSGATVTSYFDDAAVLHVDPGIVSSAFATQTATSTGTVSDTTGSYVFGGVNITLSTLPPSKKLRIEVAGRLSGEGQLSYEIVDGIGTVIVAASNQNGPSNETGSGYLRAGVTSFADLSLYSAPVTVKTMFKTMSAPTSASCTQHTLVVTPALG